MFVDGGEKSARITNLLIRMIVKENLSLNFTTKTTFIEFVKEMAPLYKIPGRTKLTSLIQAKYEVLSSKIKAKVETN